MRGEALRFEREPGVRTRSLPDLGYLLAFTPARPRMHWLNLRAWLLFELCDGASEDEILAEYATARPPAEARGDASHEVRAGLAALVQGGLVRAIPPNNQERRT